MIDGHWLYNRLKCCSSLQITVRVYSDWLRTNNTLVGFVAHAKIKTYTKEEQLLKVEKFIFEHRLPVEIEDEPDHATRFKIRILK